MTWIGQNRGHAYSEGFNLENCNFFFQKNRLMSGDLINIIGTEILRSVPEKMDLGQIEVKHISEGCNLVTPADRSIVTIKVEYEVIDALSNGAIGFDLE